MTTLKGIILLTYYSLSKFSSPFFNTFTFSLSFVLCWLFDSVLFSFLLSC